MFDKILLAVDLNDPDGAVQSTTAAIEMVKHTGAALHVLNVVPDQGMSIVSAAMPPDLAQSNLEAAREGLAAWASANIPSDFNVSQHVVHGTVYDQIIKSADKLDVGCILVGASSPSLKDYLIGPNAARVARHAKQSVFVVR